MSTRRFVAFVILITVGFGLLPFDGTVRTAGKIALALAACLFAWRPEGRRRMNAATAGVKAKSKRWVYAFVALMTGAMIALVVLDSTRISEILTLGDKLLRYIEVDAYLWLVSLAIAGRSWRLELNDARARQRALGGVASAAGAKS